MADQLKPDEIKANAEARLYVSNLKWELKDEELKEIFGEYGKVTEARIVRDRSQWSRGYGFVTFETKEESEKALAALNAKDVRGRPIRVEKARSTGPHESKANNDNAGSDTDSRGRGRGRFRYRGGGRFRYRGRGRGGRGFRGRGRGRGRDVGGNEGNDLQPTDQQ